MAGDTRRALSRALEDFNRGLRALLGPAPERANLVAELLEGRKPEPRRRVPVTAPASRARRRRPAHLVLVE